ncbi:MAG: efflux RND transporter periplasmic adaptor subunit [Candidatus Zixiibacteriota bacterium]
MIGRFMQMIALMFVCALGNSTLIGCSDVEVAADRAASVAANPSLAESQSKAGGLGNGNEAQSDKTIELDWCREHAVPESVCAICNPALIAGFKESGDWCAGHNVPESQCRLCNPEIVFPQEEILRSRRIAASGRDIEVSLFFRPNAQACATDGALIRFASISTTERAGITVQRAYLSRKETIVDAPAEVVFNEAKKYVVTSTVSALISRWLVSPGDVIKKGAPLAILQSPEISPLKSSLVSAYVSYEVERKELKRHTQMRERNLISEADFDRQYATTEQARVALVSARGLLLAAGLIEGDIDEVIKHGDVSNRFTLIASSPGTVAERIAQLGELLSPGSAFAILADPSSMWIEANLTEEQLRTIEVGQRLSFASDGRGLDRVGAEIIWVSRILDPHTRTGTVRAKVLDPNNQLQAGEFGRVKIVQSGVSDVAIVPKSAVQWEGCCNVVFVKETDQRFRPRKVQFLDGEGQTYQVTSGVTAGEEVVVDGAFLLKTELKKSSIGAGCCAIEPAG